MKYLLVLQQSGEGCDYTIGCGMLYEIVNLKTKDPAELLALLQTYADIEELEEALLIPLTAVEKIDLAALCRMARDREIAEAEAEKEREERATLARLQTKYGKAAN